MRGARQKPWRVKTGVRMGKRLLLFIFLTLLTSPAYAGLEEGLVGYWTFDEAPGLNTKDMSGSGHDGIHANPSIISRDTPPVKFKNRGSLFLDGAADYVDLSNTTDFQIRTKMTVAGWFKTSAGGARQMIIQKGDDIIGFEWVVEVDANNFLAAHFEVGTSGLTVFLRLTDRTVNDDVWHHFAALYNVDEHEEDITLYLDGVLQNSAAFDARENRNYGTNTAKTSIGARNADSVPARFFSGLVDDMRIYNRHLTVAEVVALASGVSRVSDIAHNLGPQFNQGKAVVGKVFYDWNGNGLQDDFGPPAPRLRRGPSRDARGDLNANRVQDADLTRSRNTDSARNSGVQDE